MRRLAALAATVVAFAFAAADARAVDPAPAPPPATLVAADAPADVTINNRLIVRFHGRLLGDTPAERAAMAQATILGTLRQSGPGVVTLATAGDSIRVDLDGTPAFFVTPDDLGPTASATRLEALAEDAQARLIKAAADAREMTQPQHLLLGAGLALLATVIAGLTWWGLTLARERMAQGIGTRIDHWQQAHAGQRYRERLAEPARSVATGSVGAIYWLTVAVVVELWLAYVLHQFAYTRPWGERTADWTLGVVQQFAVNIARALPGLAVAALILLLARLLSRLFARLLTFVERGDIHVRWLDRDTAGPTRRLGGFIIWVFALAMAYPYLPGANSEAFKALSVLVGLMLSMGASSVVGQWLSGLSLMYSRALRVGEFVRLGNIEGTVTHLGMFTTGLRTATGEQVSVPNTVAFAQPIRNFSRLVGGSGYLVQAAVSIGYATPWRQVHALLLEAAKRTPGLVDEPAPYVIQTALGDFYVEYRLVAQSAQSTPHRRAEVMTQLHAHIQDAFNAAGVQIMSPHYIADPEALQVVPPGPWFTDPGQPVAPPPATSR